MKHSELRHQPRHVNPRIQVLLDWSFIARKKERKCPFKGIHSLLFGKIPLKHNFSFVF